ncbi:MAG: cupin domain-containing protein [Candidatus Omnitrophota bacterium]
MSEIKIEKPAPEKLKTLDIDKWSPWECEPSTFDWEYDDIETAYVFEGKVKVKTSSGEVEINKGDLVTFPKGLKCTWHVIEKIKKVYKFG